MNRSCLHDRVVRLQVPDQGDHWICTICSEQFVPKTAVDWKIAHLTTELGSRMMDEQATGMRIKEEVSE
jgi:hypothetical protein